ncbi:ATP-binding protein [Plantactinospora sp. B6F1]|uniref:AAA family ATPase n=1 Tax=Plantactinospora sp. B6F1 TaxID=3158971 RepID=UPI0032D9062B
MLLRFRVENFASLRDETELSLIAADDHPGIATWPLPRDSLRALPAVGIFGTNASGKSNVIKALHFARDAVRYSHQRWLPEEPIPGRWPFRLDTSSATRPSEFAFDIVVGEVRYEYGFALDDEVIQREWLYAFPKGRRQVYFEREHGALRFGNHLTGQRELIAEVVRPNSLYLSAAAAQNHPQLGRIYGWFGPRQMASVRPETSASPRGGPPDERMLDLLRFADLGIVGAEFVEPTAEEIERRIARAGNARRVIEPTPRLELAHTAKVPSGRATLPWRWESTGTRAWFDLLQPAIQVLDIGGLLIVDDLGTGLHPLLTAQLLRLFHDPATNQHGAQLVFNSHDVGLLGRHHGVTLARDQVWLTEKDPAGATRLYPLTEFRVRDGLDDVEGRYLKGRYGGVPFFDEDLLASLSGFDPNAPKQSN